MKQITVRINFFGPYLVKDEIIKILDQSIPDTIFQSQREMLTYFFELPFSALSEQILERYAEVTTEELHTPIVPNTKEIFERLLKPLRSAKKCYCFGDYTATIALCGIVGEMLAILLWKINDVRLNGKTISEQNERRIFGYSFENLGQDKRLRVLETFGHITETQAKIFDFIRKSRKPYLHLWTSDLKNEQADSLDVFKKSFQLFKEITGIGLADAGTVKVNPLLMKLFENQSKELEK